MDLHNNKSNGHIYSSLLEQTGVILSSSDSVISYQNLP